MKLIILLTIVTAGLVQAHKEYFDYIYFVALGGVEGPLRYANSETLECYKMMKPEYEKITRNLNRTVYDDFYTITRKYHKYEIIKRAIGNLKAFTTELLLYQDNLWNALREKNYTLANEHHWEVRKNLELHYSRYNMKLNIMTTNHKPTGKSIREHFDNIFQKVRDECRPISNAFKDCLKGKKCTTYIEGLS